jgi:hypothetical protein
MVWLGLETVAMPNCYRLHSKAKWDTLTKHERFWHKVAKECASKDEANTVMSSLLRLTPYADAAVGGPQPDVDDRILTDRGLQLAFAFD